MTADRSITSLELQPMTNAGRNWTAQLVDESKPDGLVVFVDEQGTPRMWMPREDYDAWVNT